MRNLKRYRTNPAGFTLIELLIVLGIITILMSILLPAIARVRLAARDADAKMLISNLRLAIEAYSADDLSHSYPGPFSTDAIGTNCIAKTGAENLVLGLCGGLNNTGAYVSGLIGTGAWNMNPQDSRQIRCYLDARPGSDLLSAGGVFTDDSGNAATMGNVPVFLDRYDPRLPILYLRARKGVAGVVGLNGSPRCAYDLGEVTAYTTSRIGGKTHGLQAIGVAGTISDVVPSGGANAYAYLKDPNSQSNGNAVDTPRQKDGYILISAGADRTYGTADDIVSFGGIRE